MAIVVIIVIVAVMAIVVNIVIVVIVVIVVIMVIMAMMIIITSVKLANYDCLEAFMLTFALCALCITTNLDREKGLDMSSSQPEYQNHNLSNFA